MIPEQAIVEWRREAPWDATSLVEQDLIIARALVEMYSLPEVADKLHRSSVLGPGVAEGRDRAQRVFQ